MTDGSVAVTRATDAAAVQAGQLPDVPYFVTPEDMVQVWSSLPKSEAGRIITAMQGGTAAAFADHIGEEFTVEHIIAHRVQLVDEDTGEVNEADRIILVSPTNEMLAAVSVGLKRGVQLLMAFYGVPPWKPGLRVELRQVNTRKKRRAFTLVPMEDPAERKAAGKAGK